MNPGSEVECVVVGGGPAGLTAATYLARYRRNFVVFDKGESRAEWIPWSHNCPGFPEGIAGPALLKRLREQAQHYGVSVVKDEVLSIQRHDDGWFDVVTNDHRVRARKVLLATGIIDLKPDLDNIGKVIREGHLRLCPVCDGYEVIDKRVAVLGPITTAIKKAFFLRSYTEHLSVLPVGKMRELEPHERERLDRLGIHCELDPIVDLQVEGDEIVAHRASGATIDVEVLYPALGCEVRSSLALDLGAKHDSDGYIEIDTHQRTSIPGLYAAGDVVTELNQISVAFGHAAIAATEIYNRLREEEDAEEAREASRPSAVGRFGSGPSAGSR